MMSDSEKLDPREPYLAEEDSELQQLLLQAKMTEAEIAAYLAWLHGEVE